MRGKKKIKKNQSNHELSYMYLSPKRQHLLYDVSDHISLHWHNRAGRQQGIRVIYRIIEPTSFSLSFPSPPPSNYPALLLLFLLLWGGGGRVVGSIWCVDAGIQSSHPVRDATHGIPVG